MTVFCIKSLTQMLIKMYTLLDCNFFLCDNVIINSRKYLNQTYVKIRNRKDDRKLLRMYTTLVLLLWRQESAN